MRGMKRDFETFCSASLLKIAAAAVLLTGCIATSSVAQQAGQKTFSSPDEAVGALMTAAQKNDLAALLEILGPEAKQIVSSGDETEDNQTRADIVKRYEQMHRLRKEPDGSTTLYIGAENWPLPIPLRNKGGSWYFDTAAGKEEILFRRIGRNEMSAMRVCQELVTAQKEYYAAHRNEYARKIFSDAGTQNGLYWKAGEGEPQSPIGPLVASAVAEGYAPVGGTAPSTPYRGYYFHTLTRQGAGAAGGAKSYMLNGQMSRGFAFVAYPAQYRSSGVMTFIVAEDGVVYSKDLGKLTAVLAKSMKEYNPDSSWKKEENPEEKTAGEQKPN